MKTKIIYKYSPEMSQKTIIGAIAASKAEAIAVVKVVLKFKSLWLVKDFTSTKLDIYGKPSRHSKWAVMPACIWPNSWIEFDKTFFQSLLKLYSDTIIMRWFAKRKSKKEILKSLIA